MAYQAAEIEEMLLRCGALFKRRGFPFSDKFIGGLHEGKDNGSRRRGQSDLKNTNDSLYLFINVTGVLGAYLFHF